MILDETDKRIIRELQISGRESASFIAEKINVSIPTITDRIKKLQETNVIIGFQAILNPAAVGLDISAIITIISGSSKNYKEVTHKATNTPEVIQCFSTTGVGSHKLIVNTKNTAINRIVI
mgnify:CR=1 FL=1